MKTKWCVLVFVLTVVLARAQTNDLTALLQQGLLEEQANRNYDAAIADYQSLATQFDKDRQLAATAMFRLGECYRMQGKTNEAALEYQRILTDFSDQQVLVTLSRQDLAGMGSAPSMVETGNLSSYDTSADARSLAAQLSGIAKLAASPDEQAGAVQAIFPDEDLKKMLLNLSKLRDQEARLKVDPRLTVAQLYGEHVVSIQFALPPEDGGINFDEFNASRGFHDTNLLADAERELNKQRTWIAGRVDFIIGTQKARLKVLQASAGPESLGNAGQSNGVPPVTDDEDQEIQRIQQMVQNSPDLINGDSLGIAAGLGQLRVATYLLDHGANVNLAVHDVVPLVAAAKNARKTMVELLLNRGAEVNAREASGENALHAATKAGYQAVVEVLLAHQADVNQPNYRYASDTPLHLAVVNGYANLVSLFLTKGANIDATNDAGMTPLHWALFLKRGEIVKLLLTAGANVNVENNNGRTPLSYAADSRLPETVKWLLAEKADPNGGKMDAPLLCAIHQQDMASAELLLQAGANPNAEGTVDGQISQSAGNYNSVAPLFLAVYMHQYPMVQLLLKYKADSNDSRTDRWPMLFGALSDTNILEALLDAGAKVDPISPDENQWTPLGAAAGQNFAPAVEILLRHDANPNVSNRNGATPLQRAAYRMADPKIFELLLAFKADPNVRSSNGKTPLHVLKSRLEDGNASQQQKTLAGQLADLLRQHGALDNPPDWNRINVSRPADNFSETIFQKSTNDWNHFTLLDLICEKYPGGGSWGTSLPFPNLAHLVINRPGSNGTVAKRIEVNLLNATNGVDCSQDIPLEFGDTVEIPEREHALAEPAVWLTAGQYQTIMNYFKDRAGAVKLIVDGGETIQVPLTDFVPLSPQIEQVLLGHNAQVVLTSDSDSSRVKVSRRDPQTGQTQDWVLDCSFQTFNNFPNHSFLFRQASSKDNVQTSSELWLRDGDVIEVPAKQ